MQGTPIAPAPIPLDTLREQIAQAVATTQGL